MAIPNFTDATVLVTGGAGFIGSHLVDALLEKGARVRVLDNLATGTRKNLIHCMDRIEFVEGDVRDQETCRRACRDVKFLFHQAALASVPLSLKKPDTFISVNVTGTANVLNAAREMGLSRVVYASSSSVYGDSQNTPKREGQEGQPASPYAFSKLITEELAKLFFDLYGLQCIGLRYFNVYGPRQDPKGPYAAVIPRFLKACLHEEPQEIFGDGKQSRDFTFVQDVVRANFLAAGADKKACGHVYNVGAGIPVTIIELANITRGLMGSHQSPVFLAPRAGDVRKSLADLQQAKENLDYEPFYDLATGLKETSHFYLEKSKARG